VTAILSADLHLTDHPRDADRWNLFPWLRDQIKKHKVTEVIVCGDLTDSKDRHSSVLVNRFVDEFASLARMCNVYLIRGNHDYISEEYPFFMFMRLLAGWSSTDTGLDFVREPFEIKSMNALALPNTKNIKDWDGIDWNEYDYIFTHQTYDGCIAENGQVLNGGLPPSIFKGYKGRVYSGDIHVPQDIGRNITYIGAPYRIKFGDSYTPRLVLLKNGKATNLYFPAKAKELIVARNLHDVEKSDFVMGSQVKVRVRMKRSEYPDWPLLKRNIKTLAQERGWELYGPELVPMKVKPSTQEPEATDTKVAPEEELRDYARRKKLDKNMIKHGLAFLEEAKNR